MGIFRRSVGHGNPVLEQLLQCKRSELHNLGREQARSAGMTVMGEANALLESCAVLAKPREPEAYVDLALGLLSYPPELAFVIASQFSELESGLGYQPFGTIMTAVGNIDSLYQGAFIRLSITGRAQEVARVMEDRQFRLDQAGKFMAVAIIMTANNVARAKEIYRQGIYGPLVKPVLDREMERYSSELAHAICA